MMVASRRFPCSLVMIFTLILAVFVIQNLPTTEAKRNRYCLVRMCKWCKRFTYGYSRNRNRRSSRLNVTDISHQQIEGENDFDLTESAVLNSFGDEFVYSQQPTRKEFYFRQRAQLIRQCRAYRRWRYNQAHKVEVDDENDKESSKRPSPIPCIMFQRQVSALRNSLDQVEDSQHQKRSTNSHRLRCRKIMSTPCCKRYYYETVLIGFRYKH